MRLPPAKRSERTIIADLVSTLSLLDPDPATRIQSIRDTGGARLQKYSPIGMRRRASLANLAIAVMP